MEENTIKRAYGRCSTNEKKQDITRQINEFIKNGVKEENVIFEFISGTKENKPKLMELLDKCNAGDTIVCYELSRLSRSFKDFFNTLEILKDKQLRLELLINHITIDFSNPQLDPFTSFFLNIMMAFNNLEVEVTRQRIKSGLENCKRKGIKLGRPKITKEDIPDKFYRLLDLYNKGLIRKCDFASSMGWSRPKLDRYLKINEQ